MDFSHSLCSISIPCRDSGNVKPHSQALAAPELFFSGQRKMRQSWALGKTCPWVWLLWFCRADISVIVPNCSILAAKWDGQSLISAAPSSHPRQSLFQPRLEKDSSGLFLLCLFGCFGCCFGFWLCLFFVVVGFFFPFIFSFFNALCPE